MVTPRELARLSDLIKRQDIKAEYDEVMLGLRSTAQQGYYTDLYTPTNNDIGDIVVRALRAEGFDVRFLETPKSYMIRWSRESRVLEEMRPF